jgi:hypothetical protein
LSLFDMADPGVEAADDAGREDRAGDLSSAAAAEDRSWAVGAAFEGMGLGGVAAAAVVLLWRLLPWR